MMKMMMFSVCYVSCLLRPLRIAMPAGFLFVIIVIIIVIIVIIIVVVISVIIIIIAIVVIRSSFNINIIIGLST